MSRELRDLEGQEHGTVSDSAAVSSSQPFFSFGECCLRGTVLPGEPRGIIKDPKKDGSTNLDIPYYLVSSAPSIETAAARTKVAVVIFYDIFGLSLPNPKIIADKLCDQLSSSSPDRQIDVYVPDILLGGGMPESVLAPLGNPIPATRDTDPHGPTKKSLLSKALGFLKVLPYLPRFLATRGSVGPRCLEFVKGLRKDGYHKVGAVGFCFGGTQVINLLGDPLAIPPAFSSSNPDPVLQPLLDVAVICHPGPSDWDNIKKCRIPTAWICSEEDMWFSDEKREEVRGWLEEIQKDHHVPYEMRKFDYTVHGFAARPHLEYEPVREAFLQSGEMIRDWLKAHL